MNSSRNGMAASGLIFVDPTADSRQSGENDEGEDGAEDERVDSADHQLFENQREETEQIHGQQYSGADDGRESDRDRDGVTDDRERAMGSNVDSSDTDKDDYADGFEDRLSDEEIVAVLSWIKSTWPPEIRARVDRVNAEVSR